MFDLKKPTIDDKLWVDELLEKSGFRGADYAFGNIYAWRNVFNTQIGKSGGFLIIRQGDCFIYPAGSGNISDVVSQMKEYCSSKGEPLIICAASKEQTEELSRLYPGETETTANENLFDYIYSSDDLAYLKGKKFHSKRNYINRFNEYNWSYERISAENIAECRELMTLWLEQTGKDDIDEKDAMEEYFSAFDALGLTGGMIRVDGKPVAFTFGEKVNDGTFIVHAEKARTEYSGAFQMINSEFVRQECLGYRFINREEDMGDENLRKAKQSYRPVFLEEKYTVTFGETK